MLWWNLIYKYKPNGTYYAFLKFGSLFVTQLLHHPHRFKEWWTWFDINKTDMDPIYFQSDYRQACEECIDCFHQPGKIVAFLNRFTDVGILFDLMAKHH